MSCLFDLNEVHSSTDGDDGQTFDAEEHNGMEEGVDLEQVLLGDRLDEDMQLGGLCVDRYVTPTKCGGGGDVVAVVEPPAVGMVFPSWEALDTYYKSYGMQEGFGVVRASSGRCSGKGRADKQRRNGTWTCECYGRADRRRRVNGRRSRVATDADDDVNAPVKVSKKCECPVMIYASINEDKEWQIRRAVNEHKNHDKPTPGKSRYISMYRKLEMTSRVRRQLKLGQSAGLKSSQMHNVLALERNGLDQMGITERDVRNELAKEKRLQLKDGDANAMVAYFYKMTSDNCDFCHSYRLDDQGQLQDVVWVDARSRVAYRDFGDVVCFDATYLTNEYEMPFANFVGVNHHGQSILLGCALVSRETAETYEWVFATWLNFMGGKSPGGILTDQAPAMRKAIAATMPESRHRWCIWHITQKFCTKLGQHPFYDDLKEDLMSAIYDSLSIEEFNVNWCAVIDKYELNDNVWLQGLYVEKEMWIPACLKHMFWAGMKTTQRVESINSFFHSYVNKHTRLYEFAQRYCKAMEARAESERQLDAHDARYTRQLQYDYPAEAVFQKCYTDQKFKEVQRECGRIGYLNCYESKKLSDHETEYVMSDRVWYRCKKTKKEVVTQHRRNYHVTYHSILNEVSCECRLFECSGILCRHVIKLYDFLGILEVPEKYILRRWRKDVTRKHARVKVAYHDPSKTAEVRRIDKLQLIFDPIMEKASTHEDLCTLAVELLGLMDIRIDEKKLMLAAGKSNGTPTSVGNKETTPASVNLSKRKASNIIDGGDAVVDGESLYHVDGDDYVVEGGDEVQTVTSECLKDPPLKKLPHRTTSHRYYSVVDKLNQKGNVNGNGKGKGKGKGNGNNNGKGNGKGKAKDKGNNNGKGIHVSDANVNATSYKVGEFRNTSVPPYPDSNMGCGSIGQSPIMQSGGVQLLDADGSVGYFVHNSQRVLFAESSMDFEVSTTAATKNPINLQLQL